MQVNPNKEYQEWYFKNWPSMSRTRLTAIKEIPKFKKKSKSSSKTKSESTMKKKIKPKPTTIIEIETKTKLIPVMVK